jgi:hypothetical protein
MQKPLGLGAINSLANLQQVEGTVAVQATAWTDATSLSGLSCVGSPAAFVDNGNLASFAGLQRLSWVNFKGLIGTPVFLASNNTKLAASGYAALRTLAKCPTGSVSPLTVRVNATASVGTGCPKAATSYTGICIFAQQGTCVGVV